ncbi:hypothetical protein H0H93_005776 [Arthromyces matolae]|nr:hypothetical protein H0H93_005776 [Arthromyces matolae]
MSQTHVIDNQEPQLFHFDSYDESDLLNMPASDAILSQVNMSANDSEIIAQVSSHNEDTLAIQDEEQTRKGKTVQRSLPIPVPTTSAEFDGYPASIASTSHSSTSSADLLTPLTPPYHENYTCNGQRSRGTLVLHEDFEGTDFPLPVSSWKGKERELPPVLPPLAFSPTEFTYLPPTLSIGSPSSGPSSYNSSILQSPHTTTDNPTASQEIIIPALLPPSTSQEFPQSSQPIYRPRSLSDISLQSPGSLAAHSNPQLSTKSTLPGSSSNLARKFLSKKSDAEACNLNQLSSQAVVHCLETRAADNASGLWCTTGLKVDELDATIARLSHLQIQANYAYSLHAPFNHVTQAQFGSSQSLPFPLSSPLDIVPPARDFFVPIRMITKNYFDDYLPRELRLRIFEALLHLHEGDHLRLVRQGRWSVAKASSSRNRWVGRDRGVCEIVKLSRASTIYEKIILTS